MKDTMVPAAPLTLSDLYTRDETAWLETMAGLLADGRYDQCDFENLREYLRDMARRDRREVVSRLTVLLVHLLKWDHQPQNRSGSWKATILSQRHTLQDLLESGTLRNHAEEMLAKAYERAVMEAAAETQLPVEALPADCPWTLDEILTDA